MTAPNVIEFLRRVAGRPDLLDALKTRSKEDVIAAAGGLGLAFSAAEFDSLIWDLEVRLAAKRGEPFDGTFPLWSLMWGAYYLEYLVADLLPGLVETGLVAAPPDPA